MIISRNVMRSVERVLGECIRTKNADPYGCCAAYFLGIPVAKVTKEQRDWIKQRIYEASSNTVDEGN